jgi:hypothetical protein
MEFRYLDFKHLGYSGAEVIINSTENKVTKTALVGSSILKYQHDVLQYLYIKLNENLRVPKVLGFSSRNGIDTLDLEIVRGVTLYHLFRSGDISRAKSVINTLWYSWSDKLLKNDLITASFTYLDLDKSNFQEKIKRIKNVASRMGIAQEESVIICFKNVSYIENFSPTYCHGDFTIENVIVSEDNLYLIDFIPSPFPCVEQDLSKLVQDGIAGWAGRLDSEGSFNFELFLVIDKLVRDSERMRIVNMSTLQSLSFLTMLRILPYITNDSEKIRWLECVKRLRKYFS